MKIKVLSNLGVRVLLIVFSDGEIDDDGSEEGDDERSDVSDNENDEHDDETASNDIQRKGAEEEWETIKDDDLIQPEKLLEVKSKESHIVHCPYFPMV